MKRFFILFLHFLGRAGCDTPVQDSKANVMLTGLPVNILASVREFPSQLHKCTATFIKEDVLVTTARCLYCDANCLLFVHALSDSLTDDRTKRGGLSINITRSVIHPQYERSPQRYDIGIIKLEKKVTGAVIFQLPTNAYDLSDLKMNAYAWQFTWNLQEYHLVQQEVKSVSSALCSLALNYYVTGEDICTRREVAVILGPFDQGSPVTTTIGKLNVILGFYAKEKPLRRSKVEVYQAIQPFVSWVLEILKCNFKCAPSVAEKIIPGFPHFSNGNLSEISTTFSGINENVTTTTTTLPAAATWSTTANPPDKDIPTDEPEYDASAKEDQNPLYDDFIMSSSVNASSPGNQNKTSRAEYSSSEGDNKHKSNKLTAPVYRNKRTLIPSKNLRV